MPVEANDASSIRELVGRVHDLYFRIDDLRYDRSTKTVCIPITNADERRGWFGIRYETPGSQPVGVLVFRHVVDCVVADEINIGSYTVGGAEVSPGPDASRIEFYAGDGLTVTMVVEGLSASWKPEDSIESEG